MTPYNKDCFFPNRPDLDQIAPRWIKRLFWSATVFQHVFKQKPITFSVPDPRRTEAIAPDLTPNVKGIARQCLQVPEYFRKKCSRSTKKGSGTIGTKTILGEMAALPCIPCNITIIFILQYVNIAWDVTCVQHMSSGRSERA